jgi:hypothetical protein
MDNESRADRAARAWDTIRAYAEARGDEMERKPLEFWVKDLLDDIRDLCNERSFDFGYLTAEQPTLDGGA